MSAGVSGFFDQCKKGGSFELIQICQLESAADTPQAERVLLIVTNSEYKSTLDLREKCQISNMSCILSIWKNVFKFYQI